MLLLAFHVLLPSIPKSPKLSNISPTASACETQCPHGLRFANPSYEFSGVSGVLSVNQRRIIRFRFQANLRGLIEL